MSHNADAIVQELHAEFESMLSYVKDSHTATADQIERGLFRRLLNLGARLMVLFFTLRLRDGSARELSDAQRCDAAVLGRTPAAVFLDLRQAGLLAPLLLSHESRWRQSAGSGVGFGHDCYSDLVRELAGYFGVESTYDKVAGALPESWVSNCLPRPSATWLPRMRRCRSLLRPATAATPSQRSAVAGHPGRRQGCADGTGDARCSRKCAWAKGISTAARKRRS